MFRPSLRSSSFHRLTFSAAIALLLQAATAFSQADPKDPLETAHRYATAFFAADQAVMDEFHDATMRTAMNADAAARTRAALSAQLGELRSLGTAWAYDEVQGYHRYRVPATFTKAGSTPDSAKPNLDVMVVLDKTQAVAGFSVVPLVEQLSEEPVAPGQESEVTVGNDDGLPGTLLTPEGEGPFPAVVLVHGSGPSDRDGTLGPNKTLRDIAWGLSERGIASLRYEKRSKHNPQSLMQHGADMTLVHEVLLDAQEAVRTVRSQPKVDADRVFVVGHSMGGHAAPRIALMEEPPAGVIVLAGPATPFAKKIVEQTEYIVGLDGVITEPEQTQLDAIKQAANTITQALKNPGSDPPGYYIGAPIAYYRDLEANQPPAIARESERPILVLQGDRDYQVTVEDFAVWEAALADTSFACFVRFPTLNHHFHDGSGPSTPAEYEVRAKVDARMLQTLANWLLDGTCPDD